MEILPYKLLVVDTENFSILLTDGESGEILTEWPFSHEYTPIDIQFSAESGIAYIPAINQEHRGVLFTLTLSAGQLAQLPLDLPPIERFAIGPNNHLAMLVTTDGALFTLDIKNRHLTLLGRSSGSDACVGLAVDTDAVYTVWQHEGKGILAVFSTDGQLRDEQLLLGLPTNLSQSEHYLFIPFTTAEVGDEGVTIIPKQPASPPSTTIVLHHCPSQAVFRTYPCHVAVTPDEAFAYVVQEDSANISIVDIKKATVSGYIPVGKSLSCLTLLPDSHFAVAGSYMFADLSLIDLVNRRLLSLTDCDRELFGQVAVIDS